MHDECRRTGRYSDGRSTKDYFYAQYGKLYTIDVKALEQWVSKINAPIATSSTEDSSSISIPGSKSKDELRACLMGIVTNQISTSNHLKTHLLNNATCSVNGCSDVIGDAHDEHYSDDESFGDYENDW